MNPFKRLFSYTFRFKFSFILSIFGFILFASADIAAVEWIRRIIEYINSDKDDFSIYLVLALNLEKLIIITHLIFIIFSRSEYSKAPHKNYYYFSLAHHVCPAHECESF